MGDTTFDTTPQPQQTETTSAPSPTASPKASAVHAKARGLSYQEGVALLTPGDGSTGPQDRGGPPRETTKTGQEDPSAAAPKPTGRRRAVHRSGGELDPDVPVGGGDGETLEGAAPPTSPDPEQRLDEICASVDVALGIQSKDDKAKVGPWP